ncbi:MAG: hypothetical protein RR060_03490, partial [Victivallaceae bacterium]
MKNNNSYSFKREIKTIIFQAILIVLGFHLLLFILFASRPFAAPGNVKSQTSNKLLDFSVVTPQNQRKIAETAKFLSRHDPSLISRADNAYTMQLAPKNIRQVEYTPATLTSNSMEYQNRMEFPPIKIVKASSALPGDIFTFTSTNLGELQLDSTVIAAPETTPTAEYPLLTTNQNVIPAKDFSLVAFPNLPPRSSGKYLIYGDFETGFRSNVING